MNNKTKNRWIRGGGYVLSYSGGILAGSLQPYGLLIAIIGMFFIIYCD